MTALDDLSRAGVAVWLDDLGRHRLASGQLAALVADHRVVGVTSNPSIFAAAVGDGSDYAEDLGRLARSGADAATAVAHLTASDVREACDLLLPAHRASGGRDGRVSLEVDPGLAHDAAATVEQARSLVAAVDRPNLLVKIPATEAGLPAVTAALAEGISVNVTLIFSLDRYASVLDAWLTGLEQAAAGGRDLSRLHSVASFFVSRLDTAVDRRLDAIEHPDASRLRGRAALANARLAYERFERMLATDRWQRLAAAGAVPQRPLWASTGTKDPTYDDTRYVTGLVVEDTVNTMPYATLLAVADHGAVSGDTVRPGYEDAREVLAGLAGLGISYDEVVATLEAEGVRAFQDSWAALLAAVGAALEGLAAG